MFLFRIVYSRGSSSFHDYFRFVSKWQDTYSYARVAKFRMSLISLLLRARQRNSPLRRNRIILFFLFTLLQTKQTKSSKNHRNKRNFFFSSRSRIYIFKFFPKFNIALQSINILNLFTTLKLRKIIPREFF